MNMIKLTYKNRNVKLAMNFKMAMVAVFSLFMLVVSSCQKEVVNLSHSGPPSILVKISGVEDENRINVSSNTKSASNAGHMGKLNSETSDFNEEIIALNGFQAVVNSSELPMSTGSFPKLSARAGIKAKSSSNFKSSGSPMSDGITYRIMLYEKSNGVFYKSFLARAGTALTIPVEKGKVYQWYAYSYNTDEEIKEPADLSNPSLITPVDRDLMYDSGEIATDVANTPLPITFKHKLGQVLLEINTKDLYGVVNNTTATFASETYFNTGTFHIRDGSTTDIKPYIVKTAKFVNVDTNFRNITEARFYTADPSKLEKVEITIRSLTAKMITGKTEELIKPTLPRTITYSNFSPQIGKILKGSLDIFRILRVKTILHASRNTEHGFAAGQASSFNLIDQSKNFGPNKGNIVRSMGFKHINVTVNINLKEELRKAVKPDIVIIGQEFFYDVPTQAELLNYIKEGGVLLLMSDAADTPVEYKIALQKFLNSVFNVASIQSSYVNNPSGGSLYRLGNFQDPILNGPFGDVRDKLWGDDYTKTTTLTGIPEDYIIPYSNAHAINRADKPDGVTMFRHKFYNFMWIGDGGFLSNYMPNGIPSPNDPRWIVGVFDPKQKEVYRQRPFGTDKNNLPIPMKYGEQGNGVARNSQNIYNSTVFANFMTWASIQAEFFGINAAK